MSSRTSGYSRGDLGGQPESRYIRDTMLVSPAEICGFSIQHLERKRDGYESVQNYGCSSRREHTEYQELSLLSDKGRQSSRYFLSVLLFYIFEKCTTLNIALFPWIRWAHYHDLGDEC